MTVFILFNCIKDNKEIFEHDRNIPTYLTNVLYVILTSWPSFGLSQAIHIVISDVSWKDITTLISTALRPHQEEHQAEIIYVDM